ncbi:cation:dicarboxylase symporter family transporter, partial [bacterium]|nr:cation:dicarboxylase symporter family transporter [bacterium]
MQKKLSVLMLLGFVLSIPFAKFFPELTIKSKFLGNYFIYLLKSFVPFLIFGTITFSIASFESGSKLKKIVPLTLLFYITSTLIAIIYALSIASNINFAPDQNLNIGASLVQTDSLSLKSSVSIIAIDFSNFFNLILDGNPIAIMILSTILGLLLRVRFSYQTNILNFFSYINNLVIKITNYLMLLAPVAIFSLFSNLLIDIDNDLLFSLLRFVVICIFVFLIYRFF